MKLKDAPNPIDEAGAARRLATNLFYGWGYNFYRKENQLRADDLLVRDRVSDLLGEARAHLAELERGYREKHLPPPTRKHPVPDASAIAAAQALHEVQQRIGDLEVRIRNAPVPEMDRVNQRHRNEGDTLRALRDADLDLVAGTASLCHAIAALHDAATAAEHTRALIEGGAFTRLCERRSEVLSGLR
ncbi:MAG TPA: hypothetical protein VF265_08555 [Nevskiaceae bacterium]